MALSWFPQFSVRVAIFSAVLLFSSVNSEEIHYETQDLPPVILVPGLGGSQLEAKFNDLPVECSNFTGAEFKTWFTLFANDQMFASEYGKRCLMKSLSLVFDNKTGKSHNVAGVETRPRGWGTVEGIKTVDKDGYLSYMEDIIYFLSEINYTPGENLFGAPYDFRYAPNQLQEFFIKLKYLIEHTVALKKSPVVLVAHSMGAPLLALFLNDKTSEWRKQHIVSMITLSGAWGGAVSSIETLMKGLYGIDILKYQLRTDQSVMYMMPDLDLWGERDTIVTVGDFDYSMFDIEYLLTQMNLTENAEMYRWQSDYHRKLSLAPHVPLHCLYGDNWHTLESFAYHDWESYPNSPYRRIMGNGDGTVNHRSLDMCRRFNELQEEPVSVKAFKNINHGGMVSEKEVLNYILNEIKMIATQRYNDRKKKNGNEKASEEGEVEQEVVNQEEDDVEKQVEDDLEDFSDYELEQKKIASREATYLANADYFRNRAPILRQLKEKLKQGTASSSKPIISLRELVGPPK